MSGATAASASFSDSSPRTSSRSAAWTQTSPERSVNTRQFFCVLNPGASGAYAVLGGGGRAHEEPPLRVEHLEGDLGLVVWPSGPASSCGVPSSGAGKETTIGAAGRAAAAASR